MTNYNDGNWHGWNGGECPVHPKTVVTCLCPDGPVSAGYDVPDAKHDVVTRKAKTFCWGETAVAAFRVVREYKEPREWWLTLDPDGDHFLYDNRQEAVDCSTPSLNPEFIHVREVLEDDA